VTEPKTAIIYFVEWRSDCSKSQFGHEYMGSKRETASGRQCQAWSSDTPHTPSESYVDELFPDGSRAAAENYCRNPDTNYDDEPWCYTVDPNTRYEYCGVPLCDKGTSSILVLVVSPPRYCAGSQLID